MITLSSVVRIPRLRRVIGAAVVGGLVGCGARGCSARDGGHATEGATSAPSVGEPATATPGMVFSGAFSALIGIDRARHEVLLLKEQTPREPTATGYLVVGLDGTVRERIDVLSSGVERRAEGNVALSPELLSRLAHVKRLARRFTLLRDSLPFLSFADEPKDAAAGDGLSNPTTWNAIFAPEGAVWLDRGRDDCWALDHDARLLRRRPVRCPHASRSSITAKSVSGKYEEHFGLTHLCFFDGGSGAKLACCSSCREPTVRCDNGTCGLFAKPFSDVSFWLMKAPRHDALAHGNLHASDVTSIASSPRGKVAVTYRAQTESTLVFDPSTTTVIALRHKPEASREHAAWLDDDTLVVVHPGELDPPRAGWIYQSSLEVWHPTDPNAWEAPNPAHTIAWDTSTAR